MNTAPTLRIEQHGERLQFEQGGQNMIECPPLENAQKECSDMERDGNLILTGCDYTEYVGSAAVALKALDVSWNTM